MGARKQETVTVQRDKFRKDPVGTLRRAETHGAVVITERNGKVHSVISVPKDDRPIVK